MFVSVNVTPVIMTDDAGHWFLHLTGRMQGYSGAVSIPLTDRQEEHILLLSKAEIGDRSTPKHRRRTSMRQEEKVAQIHGGHRNAGSGSVDGRKSDASIREKYRIENKFTSGKGIRVTRADLDKLRSECERGQMPVFQISFMEPTTLRTQEQWVLVPLSEWEKRIAKPTDDD